MNEVEFGEVSVLSFQEYLDSCEINIESVDDSLDNLTEEEFALFKATY